MKLGKETWVWKLKKVLYGLKQGGQEWYSVIDTFFIAKLRFTHTHADHCIYSLRHGNSTVIIPLYVNDLMIGYNLDADMTQICTKLEHHFEMVDLGELTWVVGMCISYDFKGGQLTIDQSPVSAQGLDKI
jgi:Reverse transcriptase (RNA-dependent DNA polymerase)